MESIDWRARHARERVRADAAETRADAAETRAASAEALAEAQRREAVDQRCDARFWKSIAERRNDKLASVSAELSALKRSAKNVRCLEAEVARLKRLLDEAHVDSGKQGTAMKLRAKLGGLRAEHAEAQARIRHLAQENAKLRETRETLSKAAFGRKNEQQEKPPSERKRGQQPGKKGHGRTQRPSIEKKLEEHAPAPEDRKCGCCGKPFAENGHHESELIEIEVKAHKRIIRRRRFRKSCNCPEPGAAPDAPRREVSPPPPPRLFSNTPYGLSFWGFVLVDCFDFHRPVRQVSTWLTSLGLEVAAGTLSSRIPRLHGLFAPLSEAIRAHMNLTLQCQSDETGWRITQLAAEGRSRRAWLWVGLGPDCAFYHIDPSRSAKSAAKLFGDVSPGTILVCDRFSAYKKLVRDLGGLITLQFCWSHARRDFVRAASGDRAQAAWLDRWMKQIAALFVLHRERLKRHDPGSDRQSAAFETAHLRLKLEVDRLFAEAEREVAGLAEADRRRKPLRSLLKHRQGLSVFLDHPATPLHNNRSEAMLRGPAIGRKLSFGSDSAAGAAMTATMYSVFATLRMNRIDVRRWMQRWLETCAENGGRPPPDLSPWLPWSMSDAERRELQE